MVIGWNIEKKKKKDRKKTLKEELALTDAVHGFEECHDRNQCYNSS